MLRVRAGDRVELTARAAYRSQLTRLASLFRVTGIFHTAIDEYDTRLYGVRWTSAHHVELARVGA
jgi:ABC-type lipoprotein release transport system permease subunit